LPGPADPHSRERGLLWLRRLVLVEGGFLGLLATLASMRPAWLCRASFSALARRPWIVLLVVLAVHAAAMLFYFSPREIFNGDPATSCDHSYHYYQIFAAHRLLQESGHLWGYDPFFMAGYPAGVIFDLDMKGAELFCHLFARIGLASAFKMYILLAFLLFPLALYAAARLFGLRPRESIAALGLGLLFWHWGRPLLGHFRWAGMHSYVLASYGSALALGLFCRTLRRIHEQSGGSRAWGTLLTLVAVVALACQVHPLAALHLFPGFVLGYALVFRQLRPRLHAALWLGLGLVIAANTDWILPFLRFRHYKTASDFWFQFHGVRDLVFLYTRETSILFAAITVLGVVGLAQLRRRDRLAASVIAASAACLFLAAFYGARIPPLANTEPGRYLVPFTMLMCVPAGLALVSLVAPLEPRLGSTPFAVAILITASVAPLLSLADNLFFDAHAVQAHVDKRFVELLAFLRQHTTSDARLLFETPGGFYSQSDLLYGGHLQALVPIETGRETIGGPYPVNFLVHAAVDFKNGELCDRPLREWARPELAAFLDRYNIGWVVAWSAPARRCFDEWEGFIDRQADFDRFRVYEVRRRHSFVLLGSGSVRADYNRIAVTNAAGDELVLAYHWLESLRCDPPLPLDAFPVPGDPVGFIRVRTGGVTAFSISNAY
jgi:hypothetical protein